MRNLLLLLFVAGLLFGACKKDNQTQIQTDPTLTEYKDGHRLKLVGKTPVDLTFTFTGKVGTLIPPDGYTALISYIKTGAKAWTAWKKLTITTDTMHLTEGLEHLTTYDVKMEVTNGTDTLFIDKVTVQTGSFTTNYNKSYNNDNGLYLMDLNQVYSLEGAVHTVYGKYFSGVDIKGQLVQRGDTNKKVDVGVEVLNDSTLTFKVPAVFSKDNYEGSKIYYLKLNNRYFRWNEGNTTPDKYDTIWYNVNNNEIHINSVAVYPDSTNEGCRSIIFSGHFGVAGFNLFAPYVYGIPIKVMQTHMSISNSAGMIVGSYDVELNNVTNACETASTAFGWAMGSHVLQLRLKSGLPAGSYTLIVYNVLVDESKRISNQFQFTIE
ncbi:hypothetical protein [Chitinophaga sp.]|uniref:hypothetical protein n=1 Tax=Chitinophaga sp. TaxID=1869181 RepID=UPI0031D10493